MCGGSWAWEQNLPAENYFSNKNGDLLPMDLGCGTLETQAEFLQDHFIRMFLIERG